MNKKILALCITLIVILVAGATVAVIFLYSGSGESRVESKVDPGDGKCGFFAAVPADAAAVLYFSSPGSAASTLACDDPSIPLLPEGAFRTFLTALGQADRDGGLGPLKSSQIIISGHYVGGMEPLLVMDLCRSGANGPAQVARVQELAKSSGLFCKVVDCSLLASSGYLKGRRILLVSTSDVLMDSSERHIAKGVSVLDKEYFARALNALKAEKTLVFLSHDSAGKIVSEVFNSEYRAYSDALARTSDWCAFAVDDSEGLKLNGMPFCGTGMNKLLNVFSGTSPGQVNALSVIPSYAFCAFAMPIGDVDRHVEAYSEFCNAKFGRVKYAAEQTRLKKAAGISPSSWAESLGIKEIAAASFYSGEDIEKVLLLKAGNTAAVTRFFGHDAKDPVSVGDYAYRGFTSLLFGSLFSAGDESKCAVLKDWVVVGSEKAVSEYVGGKALETTLAKYIAGSGMSPELKNQYFVGYFSLSEDPRAVDRVFRPKYAAGVKAAYDTVTFAPALFSLSSVKAQKKMSLRVDKIDVVKSNAPEMERDATVVVENGKFPVKNSGTGKMNTFYQQGNMYLCLADENGKGLWGVAFGTPICGRAGTVDYFANGKLQILFASGSKLYLIDRLGRFVNPFPVDLGKEILLGPDIYDFSGQRKYNVLVLHKDNTVDMYNLQGKKPADWKGITFGETIMGLPEEVDIEGKTFWVVRTSLQTLVYPFYGGEPLTTFKGNDKIRPDSKIIIVKGGIKAVNYAGKEVTVTLVK